MNHVIRHDLDEALASRAAKAASDHYRTRFAKYSLSADWTDDSHCQVGFKAKGLSVQGKVVLGPGAVTLELDVPMIFRPFKKVALGLVEQEVRAWLDRARAGDL